MEANPQSHPAAVAWLSLHPNQLVPRKIVELKPVWQKSAVYRLEGAGLYDGSVIAKRCASSTVAVERTVYEEVLPHIQYPTLRFYGAVDEPGHEFGWIFVEDAGGVRYSSDDPEHRLLGAEWLAILHASARTLRESVFLPDRGQAYHLENMRLALATMQTGISNPVLPNSSVALLKRMLSCMQAVESRWDTFNALHARIPVTLVHGGFYGKNVHVRERDGRQIICAFDWESAGWGVPVLDLAHEEISEYWPRVRAYWPSLTMGILEEAIVLGRILWVLKAIPGETSSLSSPWANKVIGRLGYYYDEMKASFEELGWRSW